MFTLAIGVCACSASSDGTTAARIEQALDEGFGGLTQSPEQPSFGEPSVAIVPKFIPTYASTLQAPTASLPMSSFRVALVWGHLPPPNDESDEDVDATAATWAGSITIDSGTIDVARTLSFDSDDTVDARVLPNAVAFTSHTLPFVDGVLLHVTTPADGTDATLHVVTSELTTDIDLQVIASGVGAITHANSDQGLAVVGWNDTGATCPAGIAYGRWVKLQGALGTFRGHVMGGDGMDLGSLRGIWGHAKEHDANVSFAKYIDLSGAFRSLVLGTYGSGQIHASLTGGDATTPNGTFVGVYSDGEDLDDGRGVFVSKWMTSCVAL